MSESRFGVVRFGFPGVGEGGWHSPDFASVAMVGGDRGKAGRTGHCVPKPQAPVVVGGFVC